MNLSLKDQLIAAGLVKPDQKPAAQKPAHSPSDARKDVRPQSRPVPVKPTRPLQTKPDSKAAMTNEQLSLAQAWKMREAKESADQAAIKKAAEEKARAKRERLALAQGLIQGQAQNDATAEIVRHFQYGKKVARVYVNDAQNQLISAGELGVAQMHGRFVILPKTVMQALQSQAPEFVALFGVGEPLADSDTEYADDKFKVPDDLRW